MVGIAFEVGGLQGGAEQGIVASRSVWEFLMSGGPIMVPILLCSVVALALAIERWLALRPGRFLSADLDEVLVLVRDGRPAEAQARIEADPTPGSRILGAGLRRRGHSLEEVERGMEDQAAKEGDKLRGKVRTLLVLGRVAPMLGLLGTVVGIQEAFHRVVNTGMGKPENLAAGIEVALVTTIAGLCVAIPTLLAAAWLQGRIRDVLLEADERLGPVAEALAARREPGHAA